MKLNLPLVQCERGGVSHDMSELLLLLTLLAAVGSLIISVVNTTFDIAWKVSHDRQNDDNKKSE